MSVIIKGKAMPENCKQCIFRIMSNYCFLTMSEIPINEDTRAEDCLLVDFATVIRAMERAHKNEDRANSNKGNSIH